jgi:hypothetical protein
MHLLKSFVTGNKVVDVVVVDHVICVEFPNLEVDPILYNITLKIMVHGTSMWTMKC